MSQTTNRISPRLQYLHAVRNEETGDALDPYFAKWPCDCCGDHLAGNRFDAEGVALTEDEKELEILDIYSVCPDCLVRWQ